MSGALPSPRATSLDRRIRMLRTAMGPVIAAALEDPDVVEIMLNPDRTLWIDRLSTGRAPLGVELSEADGERIIRLVAAHVGAEVHRGQPLLHAGFADGPFLYGMHYLPLLILVAAHGSLTRLRPFVIAALVALIPIALIHNLDVHRSVARDLHTDLAPEFEARPR